MLAGSMADDLDTWLSTRVEAKQGDQVVIPRSQTIYRTATAYLLAWQLAILIIHKAGPEVGYLCCCWFVWHVRIFSS